MNVRKAAELIKLDIEMIFLVASLGSNLRVAELAVGVVGPSFTRREAGPFMADIASLLSLLEVHQQLEGVALEVRIA